MVTRTSDGTTWAAKMCTLRGLDNKQLAQLREEIAILDRVKDHANINTLVESFWLRKHAVLLCELCSGGELFDSIVAKSYYTEDEARRVVYDVSAALAHCHSLNVVHRDLKPENLLLSHPFGHPQSRVQIADFGLAAAIWSGRGGMTTPCGTAGYVAPEVLERTPYGKEVDVWALGVITYILLCGFPPFHGDSDAEIFRQIRSCSFDYPDEYWEEVSDDACDLIDSMLCHDPAERLTAETIVEQPWLECLAPREAPVEGSGERLSAADIQVSPCSLPDNNGASLPTGGATAVAAAIVVVDESTKLGKAKKNLEKFNANRKFRAAGKAALSVLRMRRMVGAALEVEAVEQVDSERAAKEVAAKQTGEAKASVVDTFAAAAPAARSGGGVWSPTRSPTTTTAPKASVAAARPTLGRRHTSRALIDGEAGAGADAGAVAAAAARPTLGRRHTSRALIDGGAGAGADGGAAAAPQLAAAAEDVDESQ